MEYTGAFHEGKRDGIGILRDHCGRVIYEGQWKNDNFDGKGKLLNISPNIKIPKEFNYRNLDDMRDCWTEYEGEFANGLRNGSGRLSFCNLNQHI